MIALPYSAVADRLTDRLDNLRLAAGPPFENHRQKLTSPGVVAAAIYKALLDIGRLVPADSFMGLVEVVPLECASQVRANLLEYDWPKGAWTQRDDQGLLHVILDAEPQPWETMITFDQLAVRANSYSFGAEKMFYVDRFGRKIYTTGQVSSAQARIINRPPPTEAGDEVIPIDRSYRDGIIEVASQYLLQHSMSGVSLPEPATPEVGDE